MNGRPEKKKTQIQTQKNKTIKKNQNHLRLLQNFLLNYAIGLIDDYSFYFKTVNVNPE